MGLKDLFKPVEIPPSFWAEEAASTPDGGTTRVTEQWGLRLPDGDVAWNSWQGIPFDSPLDRLHMVATLQKTAQDVGFDPEDFLARYGWETRNEIAQVVYEQTGSHPLMADEVSEVGTPVESATQGEEES